MKYRTIVADPPWEMPRGSQYRWREGRASGKRRELDYPTMSLDEIATLPVAELADRHAHLYLWTTTRYLEDALKISRWWGFEMSAVLVWCKPPRGWNVGGTYASNVEFIVFATRRIGGQLVLRLTSALADQADRVGVTRRDVDAHMGTSDMGGWWLSRLPYRCACPTNEQWPRLKELLECNYELDTLVEEINAGKGEATAQGSSASRWFAWGRGLHSAKPEAFLDIVESVSPGPYLELFARRARFGWDYWGDESLSTVALTRSAAPAGAERPQDSAVVGDES